MISPETWEQAAEAALKNMGVDMPSGVQQSYRELYDAANYAALASKAMHELRGLKWTVTDQVILLAKKQHDYGHENINRFGLRGVEVRLWDKVSRYENLKTRGGAANTEPIQDTLMDMIGYSAIITMLQFGWFGLPLEGDK